MLKNSRQKVFQVIRENKWIILIFLLAFVLRISGLKHGFPFIFHPDEPALVRSATGIRFAANPAHFDWPHLHFYLNFFLYFLFIKFRGGFQILGLQKIIEPVFPLVWSDPLVFYFLSRLFDAFLGALTVIPIYLSGKTLFTKKAGLFSALILAILPFHVYVSHFALIDVPAVFWLSWALYFSSRILIEGKARNYLLAGLFVGLSASTKYHGGLSAVFVLLSFVFVLIRGRKVFSDFLKQVRNLFLSGFFALLGFVAGTPFAVLDFGTFIIKDSPKGALWQFSNVGSVELSRHLSQFFEALTYKFANDFGYTFLGLFTAFVLLAIFVKGYRENLRVWFIIIPALFFFFYISGFEQARSHYYLIVYPLVSLSAGFVLDMVLSGPKLLRLLKFLVTVSLLIPFILSLYNTSLLVRKDTRNILYKWMVENVSRDDFIVYDTSSIKPVLEKFPNRAGKGIPAVIISAKAKGERGFVIATSEDDERLDFDIKEVDVFDPLATLEKLYEIPAGYRKGPNISVYKF